MATEISFHHVKVLAIGGRKESVTDNDITFNHRVIEGIDEDGERIRITFFADDSESLRVFKLDATGDPGLWTDSQGETRAHAGNLTRTV